MLLILDVVKALSESQPDETFLTTDKKASNEPRYPTTPSGPNKRRKESHEPASTNGVNGHLATPSKTPISSPSKPVSSSSKSRTSPAPSRSTPSRSVKSRKAASPAPVSAPTPTTPGRRSGRISALPKTVEADEEEEEEAKPPLPDPVEDIAESQLLVERLKAEREAETAANPVATPLKRTREEAEAPVKLNLDGPPKNAVPVEERALATNKRIAPRWPTLQPQQKAVAWGTLAFALGWSATCVYNVWGFQHSVLIVVSFQQDVSPYASASVLLVYPKY